MTKLWQYLIIGVSDEWSHRYPLGSVTVREGRVGRRKQVTISENSDGGGWVRLEFLGEATPSQYAAMERQKPKPRKKRGKGVDIT